MYRYILCESCSHTLTCSPHIFQFQMRLGKDVAAHGEGATRSWFLQLSLALASHWSGRAAADAAARGAAPSTTAAAKNAATALRGVWVEMDKMDACALKSSLEQTSPQLARVARRLTDVLDSGILNGAALRSILFPTTTTTTTTAHERARGASSKGDGVHAPPAAAVAKSKANRGGAAPAVEETVASVVVHVQAAEQSTRVAISRSLAELGVPDRNAKLASVQLAKLASVLRLDTGSQAAQAAQAAKVESQQQQQQQLRQPVAASGDDSWLRPWSTPLWIGEGTASPAGFAIHLTCGLHPFPAAAAVGTVCATDTARWYHVAGLLLGAALQEGTTLPIQFSRCVLIYRYILNEFC